MAHARCQFGQALRWSVRFLKPKRCPINSSTDSTNVIPSTGRFVLSALGKRVVLRVGLDFSNFTHSAEILAIGGTLVSVQGTSAHHSMMMKSALRCK